MQFLEGNSFTTAARSRITTNVKQEVRDYIYTFVCPEEYTPTKSIAASCGNGEKRLPRSSEEEFDDSEDEDECR